MILIVGGLIALGLIAALAVVFLALGDRRGQNRTVEVNATPAPKEQAAVEQQAEAQMATTTAATGIPVEPPTEIATPDQIVQDEQVYHLVPQERVERVPMSAAGEEQLAAGLASQYEALTRELREVHQQSNEIERKLGLLNEIATRFEQIQNGHNGNGREQMRGSQEQRKINTETNLQPTPSLDPYR